MRLSAIAAKSPRRTSRFVDHDGRAEMPVANQSKQQSREELDRLVKEALERGSIAVTKVDGRREDKCGKCGAVNRVKIPVGQTRVTYACKECGHEQKTM
jgi:phage FluMu protein Com